MKITYFFNFFLLMVVLSTSSIAKTNSAADDLSLLLANLHSMQADFTQTTYDNYAKPIQQLHGRMALKRPGCFRWEVKNTLAQLIVANGDKLWIYDKDLAQVSIRSLQYDKGEAPALLLSHSNQSLDQDFIV